MSRRRDWGAGEFGTSSTVAGEPKGMEGSGVSGWHVCEKGLPKGDDNHVNEALFALSNGFIGIRGTFEEGYSGPLGEKGNFPSEQGIFINGFYDQHVIKYPEVGFGQAENDSVMLNVINSKIIKMEVDGEPFDMYAEGCKVNGYSRELNLQEGVLTREVTWTSPKGKKLRLEALRVVPLPEKWKNIYVLEYKVTPLSAIDEIVILSDMDGKVTNKPQSKDPRVGSGLQGQVLNVQDRKCEDASFSYIKSKTMHSGLSLVCGMANSMTFGGEKVTPTCTLPTDQSIRHQFRIKVGGKTNTPIVLRKFVTYVSDRDNGVSVSLEEQAEKHLSAAQAAGLEAIKAGQWEFLKEFFEVADISILGDDLLQQGMRFNVFHLVQAVGRDGFTNIGAKGISGEGYNGHYFWDTEIYILPFFIYTRPDIARQLVKFRISTLDKARERAKQIGGIKKGALFPWRTIHGEECSSYFPAGTAQLHINADIAWSFKQYMEATEDTDLLVNGGAEMLLEMARFWLEYGGWSHGHFQINCVTGPDEYTCLVNNNYYTNIMVQDALMYAYDVAYQLQYENPTDWKRICAKIGLDPKELDQMKHAAEKMYLPYDKYIGVHPQDDSFLQKREWDFENTPAEKYPLLLHFHYLIIYKFKVIKQADLVLALLLQSGKFTDKEKKLNFDYYEPLTTHDSSLSTAVYSVMAAEIGYYTKAYNYFKCTARMDLDNIHHNSQHGIHTACMAGTWMCVVSGFAGFRVCNSVMHLNPYLPQEWKGYSFSLTFRGAVLKVEVGPRTVLYTCIKGRVNFVHANTQKIHLKEGKKKELLLQNKFENLTSLAFDSVIIDLDAAVPVIQRFHFESWREVLMHFIAENCKGVCRDFTVSDYVKYLMNQIGGAHRFAGLEQFIKETWNLELPVGSSHDEPGYDTLWALGNKKTEIFRKALEETPAPAAPEILKLVKSLKNDGLKVGLVTYSKSGESLIEKSGLKRYVDAYITGKEQGVLGLRGKPHLDMYHKVIEQLFTEASRCVVMINDPVGFHSDTLARFKYSISLPTALLGLKDPSLDLDKLEETHLNVGMNRVILDVNTHLDSDVIDGYLEESEPYDDRIDRLNAEGLKRRSSSFVHTPPATDL